MPKKFNTPILLIAFNRPDLTKIVLNQISLIKPSKLYFAVDGPRNSYELVKVNQVRNLIKTIDWRCVVKINFQKQNLGCKYGPVAAMGWFFNNEEMGIILEDDVLADPSFFYFADKLLEKYKTDTRIGSISGNNFQFGKKWGSGSYYFSKFSHTCGWATWRRAWKLYDVNIADYPNNSSLILNRVFNKWTDKLYWKLIFGGIKSGDNNSAWDYQWNWMMWKNNLLGVIPNVNMVRNIGFNRADATHTKFESKFSNMPVQKISFPLKIPSIVSSGAQADALTQKQNYILWKELAMTLIRRLNLIYRKHISFVN